MSATGATRGDEERGLVEEWLASSLGRVRYIGTRFAVFVLAALIVVCATSTAIDLGVDRSGLSLDFGAIVEDSVAVLALALACYGIAMALAQFVTTRTAALPFVLGFAALRTDRRGRPMTRPGRCRPRFASPRTSGGP